MTSLMGVPNRLSFLKGGPGLKCSRTTALEEPKGGEREEESFRDFVINCGTLFSCAIGVLSDDFILNSLSLGSLRSK